MIEFTFGLDVTQGVHFYFQPKNVSRARIFGWEVSAFGEGKLGPVNFSTMLGYTYYYGVDMNDSSYGVNKRNANIGKFLSDAFTHFSIPTAKSDAGWDSVTAGMLRYRNPHTFKADFDFVFINKIHFGTSLQYYGYMTKIDKVFEIAIQNLRQVRKDNRNKGDFVWDLRAGYDINPNISLNFLVKNVMNSNYALRVAKPNAPRSYTVQLIVNFGKGNTITAKQNAAQRLANM
jgi:outer membrane receptor protein involved in Fe transport